MSDTETAAPKKHRSPAYPFISLGKAVDRARTFYFAERRHAAPVPAAIKHWGFADKSSGGQQTVAALKQYGLMSDEGAGPDRRVRLTDLALKILLDEVPNSSERAAATRAAALNPPLFAEMHERWGRDLPSDETIRTFLRRDKGFNDDVLAVVIRSFRETLSFANIDSADTLPDTIPDAHELRPRVGDYVQWESQGALQFATPRKLIGVSEDGSYGFVEDSTTGLPMEQLSAVDVPEPERTTFTPPPPPPKFYGGGPGMPALAGIVRDVSSLPEGEAVLQWPANISAASVQELEDWLAFVIRKMKRRYTETK